MNTTRSQATLPWTIVLTAAMSVGTILVSGCGAGSTVRVPRATVPRAITSVRSLYEAGRYQEVVQAVANSSGAVSPEDRWLAARSYLRLRQVDDARALLSEIEDANPDPAWQTVARLALAQLGENAEDFARARAETEGYPAHPFVQYQLGLALADRREFAEAARAFDRAIAADPSFAYAYYDAGLTYERLDRADVATTRFESFVRLAPEAPERPAVESVLRTMRGR